MRSAWWSGVGGRELFEGSSKLFRCVAREIFHTAAAGSGSSLERRLNLVDFCKSLDEHGIP